MTLETTEIWIACLRAYWHASGALADVEARYGGEFQRRAHITFTALENTAKTFLVAWNDDVPEGQTPILQCSRIDNETACDLYFTGAGDVDGRCPACAAIHAADIAEARRVSNAF